MMSGEYPVVSVLLKAEWSITDMETIQMRRIMQHLRQITIKHMK